MLKVFIVDDERHVREMIANILETYCTDVIIVGQTDRVSSAVSQIAEHNPDLVLLDIQLSEGTGFDLLRSFNPISFSIIFITAYEEYAVKAFKSNALDYILKPVNIDELLAAIEKARENVNTKNLSLKISNFLDHLNNNSPEEKKIVLKTQESIHLIKVSTIIRCESFHNYTEFFLEGGKKLVVSRTLKEYEILLTDFGFFRVHQSHLININNISRYEKTDGGSLILTDGSRIPVAKRKKEELLQLFDTM